MPAPDQILVGSVYGQLTILSKADGQKRTSVNTLCSCGVISIKNWYYVKSGKTTPCGCFGKKFHKTHGKSKERLYNIWLQMKARCEKQYATGFVSYGGRGISYFPSWGQFDVFYSWAISNGYHSSLTLERKDVNGNYCPINCIWASQFVQSANSRKRKKAKFTYKGVDQLPSGSWRATIQIKNTSHHLGVFTTEQEALLFRNNYIRNNSLPHLLQ